MRITVTKKHGSYVIIAALIITVMGRVNKEQTKALSHAKRAHIQFRVHEGPAFFQKEVGIILEPAQLKCIIKLQTKPQIKQK